VGAAAGRPPGGRFFFSPFLQGSFHLFPRGTLHCRSPRNGSNLEGGPPGFQRKSLYFVVLGDPTRPGGPRGLSPPAGPFGPERLGRPAGSDELRRRSLTTTGRLSVDWDWLGLVRCFSLPGWIHAGRSLLRRARTGPRAGGEPGRRVLPKVSLRGRSTRPSYRRGRRPDLAGRPDFVPGSY